MSPAVMETVEVDSPLFITPGVLIVTVFEKGLVDDDLSFPTSKRVMLPVASISKVTLLVKSVVKGPAPGHVAKEGEKLQVHPPPEMLVSTNEIQESTTSTPGV